MSMPEILPPEILTAAGSAWDKAHERQEAASQGFGSAALFGALDGAVSEAREKGGAGFGVLENVADPTIRELFKQSIEDYRTIFAGAGIDMPTPAELAQGGIDFGRLAELKKKLPDYDLVVAPLVLPINTVRQLVSTVAQDKTVSNNPLGIVQTQTREKSDGLPIVDDGYRWTAFLLLNNDDRDRLMSYEQAMKKGRTPTPVTGYVAYQLYRIHQAMSPADPKGWVVTSNEFAGSEGSTNVLTSCFSNFGSDIMIRCRGIEYAKTFAKVRPLVG